MVLPPSPLLPAAGWPEWGRVPRWKAALLLSAALAGAVPLPLHAQVRLPSLGESAADEFSTTQERRLGEQIMRDIRRDPDYADDPLLLDYLNALWKPLVAAARARGDIHADTEHAFAFEAFMVRDRAVNAFALPGGFIGVHYGLLAAAGSRDELASVLAHELSHVTQRHIARMITGAGRANMVGMAAMLLGVLAGARSGNADVANAAIHTGQAIAAQAQLNFSRDHEREADRNGFALMAAAGYSGHGMVQMFERLEQAYRLNDSGNYPYLRSHPLTTDRIGDARLLVDRLATPAALPQAQPEHQLMQARARVLMDTSAQALRSLQQGAGAVGQPDIGTLYSACLASLLLNEPEAADALLARLQARLPASRSAASVQVPRLLAMLETQIALARRDNERAQRLAQQFERDGTRSGLLLGAQVALAAARAGSGAGPALQPHIEALQTWLVDHKADAAAWSMLAQSAQAQGMPLRAVRALAESHAALGDLNGAIDRLRAGQEMARRHADGDHIEASVIDARLRELALQRRELMAELRGERGRN